LQIFTPFIHLPSRSLSDYYQVIKHPVSLKSLHLRVRGRTGRQAATGISEFQSWDAFEKEAAYIWENAQRYNEDGSDMFNLAGEFRDTFKELLAEVKSAVEPPMKQTLKLKMNEPKQSIKIKFGAMASPSSTRTGTPAGERGTPESAATNGAAKLVNGKIPLAGSATSGTPLLAHSRSASAASVPKPVQPQVNGVKNESATQSPALGAVKPAQPVRPVQYSMPPVDGPPMGLVDSKDRPKDQSKSLITLSTMLTV
jgi:Bromodomain